MGRLVKIAFDHQAANTLAFALVAEGWNELVQVGHTLEGQGFCPVEPSDHVLYAEREDGEMIGVLCFRALPALGECHVSFVYVEPTSRRQGVFRLLLAALEAQAKAKQLSRIRGNVHANNAGMQAVLQRLAKPVVGLMYEAYVSR